MCGIWVSTHKLPTKDKRWQGGIIFTRLHTPKGTRDYLPNEVQQYRYIENQLRKNFELWSYSEVRSPTIEFVETLSTGVGSELVDTMFKFQDFDGKLLALRAEMTAPVARIVTTRMPSTPEPIRLFYVNNVFRYSQSYLKREREFCQAVKEVVDSVRPVLDQNPQYRQAAILERIVEPERIITFRVPWLDDQGLVKVNRGFCVEMNSAIGPYKSALRFHPSVNQSILKFLAF